MCGGACIERGRRCEDEDASWLRHGLVFDHGSSALQTRFDPRLQVPQQDGMLTWLAGKFFLRLIDFAFGRGLRRDMRGEQSGE